MNIETNKAIVRQWLDLWNDHALDQLHILTAPTYVHHTSSGQDVDLNGFKQGLGWVFSGYPDINYTIVHMLAEGDLVAVYVIGKGTQQGSFFDIAPTGQESAFVGIYHCRVQEGKIQEDWDVFDLLTSLFRLGARIS